MSILYKKYQLLKKNSTPNDLFLFKSGAFYIFIGEDAEKVSTILNLKLTNFNAKIMKCGFPIKSLDKFVSRLQNLGYEITIIDNSNDTFYTLNQYTENEKQKEIINTLLSIDINNTSGIEAIMILDNLIKKAKSL